MGAISENTSDRATGSLQYPYSIPPHLQPDRSISANLSIYPKGKRDFKCLAESCKTVSKRQSRKILQKLTSKTVIKKHFVQRNKISLSVINYFIIFSLFLIAPSISHSEQIKDKLGESEVIASQKTDIKLFLTARETYSTLIRNPSIVFIDIRDPIEVTFGGHPELMDVNIPIFIISRKLDDAKRRYILNPNKNFILELDKYINKMGYTKTDPIIVSCSEGDRSTHAVELMRQAGYTKVWIQIGGFSANYSSKKSDPHYFESWIDADLPIRFKLKKGAEWIPMTN